MLYTLFPFGKQLDAVCGVQLEVLDFTKGYPSKIHVKIPAFQIFLSPEAAETRDVIGLDFDLIIKTDLVTSPSAPGEKVFPDPFQLPYRNVRADLLFPFPDQRFFVGFPQGAVAAGKGVSLIIGRFL